MKEQFCLGSHQVTDIMHKGQDLETVGARETSGVHVHGPETWGFEPKVS